MTRPHGGHLADQSPGGRRQLNRPPRPKAARYAAGPHADLGLEDQDTLNETSHRSAQDAWQRSEHKQRPSGRNAPQSPTVPELSVTAEHFDRSEEHTSELQSRFDLVCRL